MTCNTPVLLFFSSIVWIRLNMTISFHVRILRPDEIHIPIEWARDEGWNPGVHDADCHYSSDPDGWLCAEKDDEIIGVAVATNYDETFSFGGFYIVREEYRNHGVGWDLMKAVYLHIGGRNFGIDGVFEMQDKYSASMGMKYAYRNIRWQGISTGVEQPDLIRATDVPFNALLTYDTAHFPVQRSVFLKQWIRQPEGVALLKLDQNEKITGYGVIRRCYEGHKIGPVFADSPDIADEIFEGLTATVPGETIFFDTPEPNVSAIQMAQKRSMTEVFGTARMYSQEIPKLPIHEIFGVTTFELG